MPRVTVDADYNPIRTLELEYYRKDGTTVRAETKFSIIRDERGMPVSILALARDITEREQAEKALMESEERFRRVSQITTDIAYSCLTDQEGAFHIDWISGAIEQTTGYTADEIMEQSCWRFLVVEEDIPLFEKNISGLSPGQSAFCDLRICHKHGEIIWVRSFAECIAEIGTSKEPRLYGGLRNITDSKKVEEKLRKSEAQYRLLAEHTADIVALMDMDLKVTYQSPSSEKLRGYTSQELKELPMEKNLAPESLNLALEALNRELPGIEADPGYNPVTVLELEYYRKDGTTVWLESKFSIIRDVSGKPVSILLEARDIQERKQIEEELKRSVAQYHLLAEHTTDFVWLMDMNLNNLYLSPSVLKRTGFTAQERTRLPLEKRYAADSLKLVTEVFSKEIARVEADPDYDPTPTLDIEYCCKDGTTFWAENRFSAIRDSNGRLISILGEARDITDRRLAEEKLLKGYESVKKTLDDAINTMVKIVELRDPYTAGHQQRVADLATAIAREMKLEDTRINQLQTAAKIHDIGKMYIPTDILSKPGKLTDLELGLIKTHSQSGYDIVKGMDFPGNVAQAVLQHHERLDGSGYPNALKGKDTLLEAKIIIVADVIEAMASHRPYRQALGIDKALEEISKNRGKLYDPVVVDACVDLFKNGMFEFK
jgi:PAS domain S-box-containing protein/putative nucleotidyltransferase with HDIG domain